MYTLKELNLVSVLKNMNDKQLGKIFNKSNPDRLYNILKNSACNCGNFNNHLKCDKCNMTSCITFMHVYNSKRNICSHCLVNNKFYSRLTKFNYEVYTYVDNVKYLMFLYLHDIPKELTYKEVLEKIKLNRTTTNTTDLFVNQPGYL